MTPKNTQNGEKSRSSIRENSKIISFLIFFITSGDFQFALRGPLRLSVFASHSNAFTTAPDIRASACGKINVTGNTIFQATWDASSSDLGEARRWKSSENLQRGRFAGCGRKTLLSRLENRPKACEWRKFDRLNFPPFSLIFPPIFQNRVFHFFSPHSTFHASRTLLQKAPRANGLN